LLNPMVGETPGARPLLVVGVPRSGSSWTANILAAADGAVLVREPDNEKLSAPAISAKRGLGRFPVLGEGDDAPNYRRLWEWAFAGAPEDSKLRLARREMEKATGVDLENMVEGKSSLRLRSAAKLATSLPTRPVAAGTVVAKSVHAFLALDWMAKQFDLDVLILLRHPANIFASWVELKLPDRDRRLFDQEWVLRRYEVGSKLPLPGESALEREAWQLGLSQCALEEAAASHPGFKMRTHEQLCIDPEGEFRSLFSDFGLSFGKRASAELAQSNRPGTGFAEQREALSLVDSWKTRLSEHQWETMFRVLEGFPIKTWSRTELETGGPGRTDWRD
jgi:hypothetical protein